MTSSAFSASPGPAPRRRLDVVGYLKLFRFPLVFTAMADSATGYFLSFKGYEFSLQAFRTLGLLALTSAGLYSFGMALNDIADRTRDREIAPGRVLPSGRISPPSAMAAALAALMVSAAALWFADYGSGPRIQRFMFWGLVVAGIATYDCFLKLPPVMGLVRACNLALGLATGSAIGHHIVEEPLGPWSGYSLNYWHVGLIAAPEFVYVTALTYVSTLEEGSLDRKRLWIGTGIMMAAGLLAASWIPVVGVLVRTVHGAAVAGELGGYRIPWLAILMATLLIHWVFRRARQAKDRKGVMLLVRDGIGGLILLNATMLLSLRMVVEASLVIALIVPAAASVAIFKRLA